TTRPESSVIARTGGWHMPRSGAPPGRGRPFPAATPPIHGWAALLVYVIDGAQDREFLVQIFHKLLLNFTWWVNRVDAEGSNLFEGGFLGLDNIGPFDRSNMPVDGILEQSDGTAWMAGYCLVMLTMALELARKDRAYDGLVTKFSEHFSRIAHAINEEGLWDEADGFFYDRLRGRDGTEHVLRYRSLVGLIPLMAAITVEPRFGLSAETFQERFAAHDERRRGEKNGLAELIQMRRDDDGDRFLVSLVGLDQLRR